MEEAEEKVVDETAVHAADGQVVTGLPAMVLEASVAAVASEAASEAAALVEAAVVDEPFHKKSTVIATTTNTCNNWSRP